MNSDHTHFIIIREQPIGSSSVNSYGRKASAVENTEKPLEKLTDSDDSATNRFRDRFEDFLHQETLQQQVPIEPTAAVTTVTTTGFIFFLSCVNVFESLLFFR